jgi:chorismate-pyruvate lyase
MPGHPFSVPFQPLATRDCPGEVLPQPARALLVHDRDLTPTLEAHHRSPLRIRVLQSERRGERYHRRVVLITADGRAVSQGEIEIRLDRLPSPIVRQVLAGQKPLGGILRDEGFAHQSRPQAFFALDSTPDLEATFNFTGPTVLHGRRNHLLTSAGDVFAEVLEILAPSDKLPPP